MTRQLLAAASALALAACATTPADSGANGVSPRALALHMRLLTLDTHLDTPAFFDTAHGYDMMKRHSIDREGTEVDYPRMNEGGLDGGFFAIYMPFGPLTPEGYAKIRDTALIRATSIHEMVAKNPDKFEIALTPADARRINASGKKFVFLSMENSYELGDDLTLLDTFYKLGVRLAGPVHNGDNQLADAASNTNHKWGGLSPMGKAWVKRCNELGVVIDGSHSGDQTIEQMIDMSPVPIILSHHGARALNDHPRNLPDALIRKLAAKGGVIQMNTLFLTPPITQSPERTQALADLRTKYGDPNQLTGAKYEAYLDENAALNAKYPEKLADFDTYMKAILYTLKLVGPEHVGFGADWDGGGGLSGYRDISYLPRVTERLLKEGYTEADLANMWGGNVLRVMQQAQDYAAAQKK